MMVMMVALGSVCRLGTAGVLIQLLELIKVLLCALEIARLQIVTESLDELIK